tara:strand:+ start:301 stop:486 length:186 start_codon:yes stop_codon:yes gene_type:complete
MDEFEYQELLSAFQTLLQDHEARYILREVVSIAIQESIYTHGHKADVAADAVLNTLEAYEL